MPEEELPVTVSPESKRHQLRNRSINTHISKHLEEAKQQRRPSVALPVGVQKPQDLETEISRVYFSPKGSP